MRDTDVKVIQRLLLQSVGARVEKFGFNPKPIGQSFFRNDEGVRWTLHLSFIRHPGDFDLTADVAVRIDAIEQIVNRYVSGLSDDEKRRSMTIGAELGNILRQGPLRWNVSEQSDVLSVVPDVVAAFEKVGLPYLNAYSDVESVYRVLGSADPEDWLHSPVLGARCMRAVAAGYILGRKSDLDQLILQYEAHMAKQDDLYLSEFRALRDSLRPQ